MSCCVLFFFFKQKTAYEMRISDWSSDVCSSDLSRTAACWCPGTRRRGCGENVHGNGAATRRCRASARTRATAARRNRRHPDDRIAIDTRCRRARSEEHTSELQSLMRISYAVFCLKKKNNKRRKKSTTHTTYQHIH